MDFLNELFGSEMGELKRHQKVRTNNLSHRPLLLLINDPSHELNLTEFLFRLKKK
jgi:hypothetical protein